MTQPTKTHKLVFWHVLALLAVVLAAPNSTIIKHVSDTLDPLWLIASRFIIITLVTLPFALWAWRAFTRTNLRYAVLAGIYFATTQVFYVSAIHLSQASYVEIINLATPILLMLFSIYMTREKIVRRSYVGIGVAALGAFSIIAAPLLTGGSDSVDVSLHATVLAVLSCVGFPLFIIYTRKANEAGLSLWSTMGVISPIVTTIAVSLALLVGRAAPHIDTLLTPNILLPLLFTALVVGLLSRLMTIKSYRFVGSAAIAALSYLESFASIVLPIVILGEVLSKEVVLGGLLVVIGVLIVESKHHKHTHRHLKHHTRSHRL